MVGPLAGLVGGKVLLPFLYLLKSDALAFPLCFEGCIEIQAAFLVY